MPAVAGDGCVYERLFYLATLKIANYEIGFLPVQ